MEGDWSVGDTYRVRRAQSEDAPAIAYVHVECWATTYAGLLPEEYIASRTLESRTAMWQRALAEPLPGRCCFVAIDAAGQLVGFAAGGPQPEADLPYTGELYAIYLLRTAQGIGIGRQLAAHVASALAAEGHRTLLIWVLASNPACRFYEALGGHPVSRRQVADAGVTLDEVAYGWEDIGAVAAQSDM